MDGMANRLYGICYNIAPNLPKGTLQAVVSIVRRNIEPNITFNIEETRRRITDVGRLGCCGRHNEFGKSSEPGC